MIEEDELQEFNDAVDAITNMLESLFYAAAPRNVAEYLVDELPNHGYRLVKMTPEEVERWEKETYEFLEDDEDIIINRLVWDDDPYINRMSDEEE